MSLRSCPLVPPSVVVPDVAMLWWGLAGIYLLGFVFWGCSLRLSLLLLVVLETWDRSWESGPSGATLEHVRNRA